MSTTEITRRINMYGGSPLNRLSWLRTSHTFLNLIIAQPSTRWLIFNSGQPLVVNSPNEPKSKPVPAYLSTEDLKPLLGAWPYFGQGMETGKLVSSEDGEKEHAAVEAARHIGVPLVFLGVHETKAQPMEDSAIADTTLDPYVGLGDGTHTIAVLLDDFKKPGVDPEQLVKKIVQNGTPYFAMDVGDLLMGEDAEINEEGLQEIFKKSKGGKGKLFSWAESRSLLLHLNYFNAAIFAVARSMVDWNYRNKFCPGCGSKAYSLWGGWKIACSTLLPWVDSTGKKPCPSGKGLHNYTHPRTDGVAIMIAVDETGNKVLLGRGRRYPGKFYSAMAGFIEPGESFEDAVVREVWEEAGVRVWNVRYHSGQPWPYPANLMLGFYARADSTQPIRTDLDNELIDARWFTREELLSVLKPEERREGEEASFYLPPATSIAGVLIRDWVEGKIAFENSRANL